MAASLDLSLPPAQAILQYYQTCLALHGDTAKGAGWPSDEDRNERFKTILDIVLSCRTGSRIVVCDLGCGTGQLLSYIRQRRLTMIDYVGIDRSAEALAFARIKHPGAAFHNIDVLSASEGEQSGIKCDFLVANGLFTVKHTLTQTQMWSFTEQVLTKVWPHARRGVIFNVMSAIVDWKRSDLFHVSYDEMAQFLHKLAGRRIGFRADYGLYEYMAYALKPAPDAEPEPPTEEPPNPRGIPACLPRLPPAEAVRVYLDVPDRKRWYSNHGPLARQLESRLSGELGCSGPVVATASSGTAALVGAILGLAGRAGPDRPICLCPAYTFVGTASAIMQCGYTIHLTDVEADSWALEPALLAEHAVLDRTGVIVVVAPYGRCVPLPEWEAFEERTGIPVVIDAAAGIEGLLDRPQQSAGRTPTVISFHATKAFCTGEGGAIVCSDAARLSRCRQALNFGFMHVRESRSAGINGKMSEYHAAVGLAELDGWSAKREDYNRVALAYRLHAQACQRSDRFITSPFVASNYSLFRAADGTEANVVGESLDRERIEHRRWYGLGLHREAYFRTLSADSLDNTDRLAQTLIGLPVAVDMPDAEVSRVVAVIAHALNDAALREAS
jgi:dTDP-4-amino-4,6-dideoxygalactose transaminase